MKTNNKIGLVALLLTANVITSGVNLKDNSGNNSLNGGWLLENNNEQQVLLFADNYFSHTAYDKKEKKFEFTRGGTYKS